MPGRSRSDPDIQDTEGQETRDQPGAAGGAAVTSEGEGGERVVAASGGFRLPLPGELAGGMDPKRLLWLGGLAALAAVEVIEWPVALVVGAGSYVAERLARDEARRDGEQRP